MFLGELCAGVVWMEAVCHRAPQEAGAGSQSCPGLQRPPAEGGCDMHPHICCSHERTHNEPHAAQPRAGGPLLCAFSMFNVIVDFLSTISSRLSVSCRDHNHVIFREWLNAVTCCGSSEHCVNHSRSKRSKGNHQKRVSLSVWQRLESRAFPHLTQWSRKLRMECLSNCESETLTSCDYAFNTWNLTINLFSLSFLCRIPPRTPRRQPRRREELFESPQTILSHNG